MAQNLDQERPSDRIECARNINLQEEARAFSHMKQPGRGLDHSEIILNEPPFDERALRRVNERTQARRKAIRKDFGEKFPHEVNQRDGPEILWCFGLR
jgi:hypothetical protein